MDTKNRVIKFRAWDKVANRMILVDNLVWDISGQLLSFNSGNFSELMQFTGLTDKNGKEIYEGEIVKTPNGIEKIEWDEENALFGTRELKRTFYFNNAKEFYLNSEVIGNVFENKSLLTP